MTIRIKKSNQLCWFEKTNINERIYKVGHKNMQKLKL
jgi:hypothetical protein